MKIGREFRIYPTKEQQDVLSHWIGCQRVIRNAKVDETNLNCWLRKNYKFSARVPKLSDVGVFDQCFSQFKTKENPWLKQVPSQILRNGVYRAKDAFSRYWKGQNKRPDKKKGGSHQSVLLTNELFTLENDILVIGTPKHYIGAVTLVAHRNYLVPKMITISRHPNGVWNCSFCFEDEEVLPTEEDLLVQHSFTPESRILAFDRGVANPLYGSNNVSYDLSEDHKRRGMFLDRSIVRKQQSLHRKVKGSRKRNKTKQKLAGLFATKKNIINDWQNKTALTIARSDCDVIAVEDLKLANMTKAPAPKPSPLCDGTYKENRAAAKAGLNGAMLRLALGRLSDKIQWKARQNGKAFIKVSPTKSSQECSCCTHTDPGNRLTQAEFYCQACGYKVHADYNASVVCRKRAYQILMKSRPGNHGDLKRSSRVQSPPRSRSSHPIER